MHSVLKRDALHMAHTPPCAGEPRLEASLSVGRALLTQQSECPCVRVTVFSTQRSLSWGTDLLTSFLVHSRPAAVSSLLQLMEGDV